MIHSLFDKHRLEGAPNFRDLGGLPAVGGKHIKPRRLLRCGHLAYITAEDNRKLREDYDLKTIIDMRTANEINRRPDTKLDGVAHIRCPIFEKPVEGVTRETPVPHDPVDSALRMAHNIEGDDPHERMKTLYGKFFTEDGLEAYTKFFDLLLRQEEGAVLWHCTMGKDRCGTGAILLETALGVPADIILADYMYTNDRINHITEDTIAQARLVEPNEELMHIIRIMDAVHPDYMDAIHHYAEEISGSLDNLIRTKLGMTEEKIAQLRAMYLE
jgi:protein-tyrosine phosphatase